MSDSPPRADDHYLRFEPRRAVTLSGAHRRADVGRILRLIFFAALAALAAGVLYFVLRPDTGPAGPEPDAVDEAEAGVVTMTNPRFSGRDTDGRPFQVLAETAIRRPQNATNVTELVTPRFYDNSEEGSEAEAQVSALRGTYDSDARILDLDSEVSLTTENGYSFRTSKARVYIDQRRAEGDAPVEGAGPFGTVTADSWAYEQAGEILHFEGNVRTVFANEDAGPAGGAQQ